MAHLSPSPESMEVHLTSANDLREFFVRNTKFDKHLAGLERDIADFVEETKAYFSRFEPEEVGRLCVGRVPLPLGVDYNVEDSHQRFAYKRVQLVRQLTRDEQQQVYKHFFMTSFIRSRGSNWDIYLYDDVTVTTLRLNSKSKLLMKTSQAKSA